MNLSQLKKQLGTTLRFRPLPIRIALDGERLSPLDDQWRLETILDKPSRVCLINIQTGHNVSLQPDNVREYRSPDFLLLRCQLIIKGPNVEIEPLLGNHPIVTDLSLSGIEVNSRPAHENRMIMQTIETSSPSDWTYYDPKRTYSYTKDVNLRIERHLAHRQSQFPESWTHRFPDPSAHGVRFTVCYGSTPLKDVYAVEVDGGRCYIPFPESAQNLRLTRWQYSFGRIINIPNGSHDFNRYLQAAGICVTSGSK